MNQLTNELKDIWKGLFPRETVPADDQWLLWQLRHNAATIKQGLSDLASKYHRLGGKMDAAYMLRFVSAVMNRITREQVEQVSKLAGLAKALVNDSRSKGQTPPPSADEFLAGVDAVLKWYADGEASEQRANRLIDLTQILVYDYPSFGETLSRVSNGGSYK